MKAVLQRVHRASVRVDQSIHGQIAAGWLLLLGICRDDSAADVSYLVRKTLDLRGFADAEGKMNLNVKEVNGEVLVVSQFTLYGDCRKGKRPSFHAAAEPSQAERLYLQFIEQLREQGVRVAHGCFGAFMELTIEASGPVTLMLESPKAG